MSLLVSNVPRLSVCCILLWSGSWYTHNRYKLLTIFRQRSVSSRKFSFEGNPIIGVAWCSNNTYVVDIPNKCNGTFCRSMHFFYFGFAALFGCMTESYVYRRRSDSYGRALCEQTSSTYLTTGVHGNFDVSVAHRSRLWAGTILRVKKQRWLGLPRWDRKRRGFNESWSTFV